MSGGAVRGVCKLNVVDQGLVVVTQNLTRQQLACMH